MVRNVSFPRNEGKDFQYMKRKSSILTRIEINQQNRLMKFVISIVAKFSSPMFFNTRY